MVIKINPIPRPASRIPHRLVTLTRTATCPTPLENQLASLPVGKPMPFRQYAAKDLDCHRLLRPENSNRLTAIDRCLAE